MAEVDLKMIEKAEAEIRADYRDKKIDKDRFRAEMLIAARARSQLK